MWQYILINALVFAIICALVAPSKGRDRVTWGIAGFIFGIFALLILAFLSDAKKTNDVPNKVIVAESQNKQLDLSKTQEIRKGKQELSGTPQDYLKYAPDFLSCTTCIHYDSKLYSNGKPWCNIINKPEIRHNICYSFEGKNI